MFLFGPTAVGKTAAIEALDALPVEVISADSMQVYRRMDIGTAKPDPAFRARIPHHLIDIRDPNEQYTVGAFVEDAERAMREIVARNRLPVVSGGTAYYFRHLLLGMPETPQADPEVRARVASRAEREGIDRLYAELEQIDPESAARIGRSDRYRITRALEVYEQTGRPLSSFAMEGGHRADRAVTLVALDRPRAELARRIAARVASMLASGLRAEVESLVAAGYRASDPGLRAIGYREFFADDGSIRPKGDDALIAEQIISNTRRYAKRQATFFRRLPGIRRVPADETGVVRDLARSLLAG